MLDELHIPQHQALDGGLATGNALKKKKKKSASFAHLASCVCTGAIVADVL